MYFLPYFSPQPGTVETISETIGASFLAKGETSRSIAGAIVEQQVLKRNVYNKTALKKTVVVPLRNVSEKPKRRKKMTADKEKKILISLVYSQIKQKEGQSTETLVGIGIVEKPPLFSTKMARHAPILTKAVTEQLF